MLAVISFCISISCCSVHCGRFFTLLVHPAAVVTGTIFDFLMWSQDDTAHPPPPPPSLSIVPDGVVSAAVL